MRIRPAEPDDAPGIAAVYNEGIAGRSATFVTEPRSVEDVRGWLVQRGPFLVAEEEGEVLGWAGVSDYSDVPAYRGVGEFAIYVAGRAQRRGVGRALLEELSLAAERAGRHKLIGKVFPENRGSRALCAACGFHEVGVHRRHGRLEGRWRDVLVAERLLGPAKEEG